MMPPEALSRAIHQSNQAMAVVLSQQGVEELMAATSGISFPPAAPLEALWVATSLRVMKCPVDSPTIIAIRKTYS